MASKYLLCLILVLVVANVNGKWRFGGRSSSRSGSSGRSSGSRWGSSGSSSGSSKPSSSSWWSSSASKPSSSSSYPSSSSGLSGSSWSSSSASKPSFSYPSSLSGLSGSSWSSSSASKSVPSYPSSLSGLSGSSWSSSSASKPSSSYPSSSFGLSGSSWSSSSASKSVPSYPSSLSGLSGSSWSSSSASKPIPGYPSSSSGLSGSGPERKYPSSTGLSGTGSGTTSGTSRNPAIKYPDSNGLSGSSTGNKHPASTVSSGSNHGRIYPASTGLSGSGSSTGNKYPSSTGMSGTSHGSNNQHSWQTSTGTEHRSPSYSQPKVVASKPSYTSHSGNNYHSNMGAPVHNNVNYNLPSYYTMPQHVYVTEYRNSGSRYSDLLTGLTLYNLGRSHSHYHEHYYYDDYYRQRYNNPRFVDSHQYSSQPQDKAHCLLRIKENHKVEVLKIPCEIVSTFTDGNKLSKESDKIDKVVCQNITTTNKTVTYLNPNSTTSSITLPTIAVIDGLSTTTRPQVNVSIDSVNKTEDLFVLPINVDVSNNEIEINKNTSITNANITMSTTSPITGNVTTDILSTKPSFNISSTVSTISATPTTSQSNIVFTSTTATPSTTSSASLNTSNVTTITTVINSTCVAVTELKDPLSVKGSPPDPNAMQCEVEIITNDHRLNSKVDCMTLMNYSKMPEPKKESAASIPSRDKLKSWLSKPPWWMSLFIAV